MGSALLFRCVIFLCSLVITGDASARPLTIDFDPEPALRTPRKSYVADQVLVRFQPSLQENLRAGLVAAAAGSQIGEIGRDRVLVVATRPDQTVEQAVAAFAGQPGVLHAQPNYLYRAQSTQRPDDPLFTNGKLWGLEQIAAPAAWAHITDCGPAIVAMLDTGTHYEHEDLAPNMWQGGSHLPAHGWDFIDDDHDPWPVDADEHGTLVAGITAAAGNNARGATGVCWQAQIMAVRVLGPDGTGTTATVIEGLEFAVENGARIINASFGALLNGADRFFREAIEHARDNDVLIIAAAGNNQEDLDLGQDDASGFYPCSFSRRYDNVVCVAATGRGDQLAVFSNYGIRSVDLAAPGVDLWSTSLGVVLERRESFERSTAGWLFAPPDRPWPLSQTCPPCVMSDPSGYENIYAGGIDDSAYLHLELGEADFARVVYRVEYNVTGHPEDLFRFGYNPKGGVPTQWLFQANSTGTGMNSFIDQQHALPIDCLASPGCSLGFNLRTAPESRGDWGVNLTEMRVIAVAADRYRRFDGTSAAAPMATGVAALLLAFNPEFSHRDAAAALRGGGEPVAGLAGITRTGRRLQAMGALAHIQPPENIQVILLNP